MRSKRKKRIVLFIACILFVFIFTACGKKEEDYRQIQVYKIDGTATVARAGSSMDVYENMQLQSGDVVETVANSYLQLKLDEDKYILLEPETKISLQATGNSVDSNTAIFLEKGAIVNQLDNPLSEDSNYQVTTPNSTMAVRGTTFRVEITYDENGESFAKVAVYSGKIECMLVFPDGTLQEPVMIEAGTEVLVRGDSEESEYVMTRKASYEELKEKVLDFLDVIISRGEELSISKEEIEVLKEAQKALEEDEAVVEEVEEEIPDEEVEETEEEKTQEEPKEKVEEEKKEEIKEEEKQEIQQPVTNPNNSGSSGDSSGGGSSSGSSSGSGGGGGESSEGSTTTPATRNVIIVFETENGTFATKTVSWEVGKTLTINKPFLQPNSDTVWQYSGENGEEASAVTDGDVIDETTGEVGEEVAGKVVQTNSGWEYTVPEGTGDITIKFGLLPS